MPTRSWPEAAAHELADHAHLVLRQAQACGQVAAEAPDVLRRDVDVERVAAPLADALVRLERVVVRVWVVYSASTTASGLGEPALVVAALVARDSASSEPRATARRRRAAARAPPTRSRPARLRRGPARASRPRLPRRRHPRSALSRRLQRPRLGRRPRARRRRPPQRRGRSASPSPARAGCARGRSRRGRELHVARVARLPACLLVAVDAGRVSADDGSGPGGHWARASSSTSVQTSS